MRPILLGPWDLSCSNSIQGSHMASSFLEHMGFTVSTVVYSVHQMQRARLAVDRYGPLHEMETTRISQ